MLAVVVGALVVVGAPVVAVVGYRMERKRDSDPAVCESGASHMRQT